MSHLSRCLLLLVAFILPAADAWAQATATTGQIEGAITDASRAPLPGVLVSAQNVNTGFTRETVADERGVYRLNLLPLGEYQISASLGGFATVKRIGLKVGVNETLTLPIEMAISQVAETVEVKAEAPVVEVTRSLFANTLNTLAIESLPINGRRFQDFVLLTPGAVPEASRGGVAIGGQRGINASFTIDGASYDNPFFGGIRGGERSNAAYTISQEAIQEFQVTSAGYAAEFGRSGGGIVNAITRSGTNLFRGSAFWFFRNESMTADDPFDRPPTDFRQHQFGASLGGPIVRDRAHFFAAWDQQQRDSPFVVRFLSNADGVPRFDGEAGTFTQTNDIFTLLGRVDYRLSSRHNASIRANRSTNEGINGSVTTSPTTSTIGNNGLERDETFTALGQVTSAFSATRLNEMRVQFARENRPREPNDTGVTVTVTGLGSAGRVSFLPSLQTDDRYQFVDSFTLLRGAHSYRAGFDLNLTHTQQPFFLSRSAGEYRFASVANYLATINTGAQLWTDFRQGFGRADVDFWQQEAAVFLQDTWTMTPGFTLNYGLRYEAQINPQPDEPNPALPGSDQVPSDTNNVAPRVGFAWDPWKDNRGVIRFNTGLYYSRTPALLIVSPFTSNGQAQLQLTFTPATPGGPVFPNNLPAPPTGIAVAAPNVNLFDPEFENPRTWQTGVGIERQVWGNLTVALDGVYARMENLQRLRDINIAPPSGTAADGRLVYANPRPNPAFRLIDVAESTARGTYAAGTVSVRKGWSGGDAWFNRGLQFQAYYTYAESKDDDSNERKFQDIFYQDWQNLAAEYTWSNNDVRHNFVTNATWTLPYQVQVGAIFSARTGFPYSRLSSTDLNNDGAPNPNDRQFVNGVDTGRNSFRQPNYHKLDLRIGKAQALGGGRTLEVAVDVFNALNAEQPAGARARPATARLTGNQLFNSNANVGVPDSQTGEPRTAQVSLRFRF